jgi:hypothetical protein
MENNYKPSGRFSIVGMLGTFIIGSIVAIIAGLISYGFSYYLDFSIPLLFPGLIGASVGVVTMTNGEKIGKSRNPFLSILIAVLCAIIAWSTIHVADFVVFRNHVYADILTELPHLYPGEVKQVFNYWLIDETGNRGIVGFLLLKAYSSNVAISYMFSGATTPPLFNITGIGLIIYWLVELGIILFMAVVMNKDYAGKPYCEKCGVRRKISFPVFGDDSNIDDVVARIEAGDVVSALDLLTEKEDGNLVRFVVEHCPDCFDSLYAELIVVKDVGPKTWIDQTAWNGILHPDDIKTILEYEE